MNLQLIDYFIYICASVLLTIWVGDTLHRNGRPFLVSVFKEDGLADSVNRLLVIGFYLVTRSLGPPISHRPPQNPSWGDLEGGHPERRPRPLPGAWLRCHDDASDR